MFLWDVRLFPAQASSFFPAFLLHCPPQGPMENPVHLPAKRILRYPVDMKSNNRSQPDIPISGPVAKGWECGEVLWKS